LELRRLDVQQSNQHVQYLAAYMPDTFMNRGGMCMLHLVTHSLFLTSKTVNPLYRQYYCGLVWFINYIKLSHYMPWRHL
jgi:hypothetical protein